MGACLSQPGSSSPRIMLSGRMIKWPYVLGNEFGAITRNYCKENKMGRELKKKVRLPPEWRWVGGGRCGWQLIRCICDWHALCFNMDYLKREKLFYPKSVVSSHSKPHVTCSFPILPCRKSSLTLQWEVLCNLKCFTWFPFSRNFSYMFSPK